MGFPEYQIKKKTLEDSGLEVRKDRMVPAVDTVGKE